MNIPMNVKPMYCETCGPSFDDLEIEFNDDGQWQGQMRVGCYGGSSVVGTRDDIVDWLREECANLVDGNVLEAAIRKIQNA